MDDASWYTYGLKQTWMLNMCHKFRICVLISDVEGDLGFWSRLKFLEQVPQVPFDGII